MLGRAWLVAARFRPCMPIWRVTGRKSDSLLTCSGGMVVLVIVEVLNIFPVLLVTIITCEWKVESVQGKRHSQ